MPREFCGLAKSGKTLGVRPFYNMYIYPEIKDMANLFDI
jgi:hypothetical protein